MLAGGFSPPPLAVQTGLSVPDLFVTRNETVLDLWRHGLERLSTLGLVRDRLCLCGGSTPVPQSTRGTFRTVVDRGDYRGPVGVVRDACEELAPDETILIAEAARCCRADLSEIVSAHVRRGADVTVGRAPDQSPSGVYVARRSTLDEVPPAGFMDMKEQWFSRLIKKGRRVLVHEMGAGAIMAARTRAEFLLAALGLDSEGVVAIEPRVVRGAGVTRSVVCDGASVSDRAIVVDSVVMPGAEIGEGSLVVRSIVAPGRRVDAGRTLVDTVAGPGGESGRLGGGAS